MTVKPVVLTLGEPAGVGGEIALKAWAALKDELPFVLIADIAHMSELSDILDIPIVEIEAPHKISKLGLPVINHRLPAQVTAGTPNPENAPEVIAMIERAVAYVQEGAACAMTTNPIHKKALQDGANFSFPGHTEFLAKLGHVDLPVMMLAAPELRVVPVTIHIAIEHVKQNLTAERLAQTIRITHAALISDFGISSPRVAVAGLNPHAGEFGAMGLEEIELISPVLDLLRSEGIDISGPKSADTMFHEAARATYDVAICMYHDQALIPLKTLNFSGGVNVTLGLPFVRTSPDHGTAFDITGKNVADPNSLIEALRMAWDIATKRGTI